MISNFERHLKDDQLFSGHFENDIFENHVFKRAVALKIIFTRVSFRATIFDTCYFRDCRFVACSFVGCRFISSNTHGSGFSDCAFDYCSFEKTNITSDILVTSRPGEANIRWAFARALRVNYQQLGDAQSVNKSILVELEASRTHLQDSWASGNKYYRAKYRGFERFKMFIRWVAFSSLDFIWGHGESAIKLLRSFCLTFVFMAIIDVYSFRNAGQISSYGEALAAAPEIFFGVVSPPEYGKWYLTTIYITRLISFAFLTSIVLKRSNRR